MKKKMKCLVALILALITVTMCAIPASATWTYPDGGTLTDYIVNTDDYNRTIYVYHRDTSGTLLKYCVYYTGTIGDYDVFGDSLYGYDIIAYESNQGLGEECKLTWAAGNGETAGYGQIGYQFYKLISKKSLISTNNNNISVEFKCSELEKNLITTDRRELQEILKQKTAVPS